MGLLLAGEKNDVRGMQHGRKQGEKCWQRRETMMPNRGRYGFFRGRDLACEVGCGLFQLGLAHRGKWEYSLYAKSSLCQFFYCGGEERVCGGLRVRIVLSTLLFVSAALELLFLLSSPHWALQLHRVTSR